MTTYPTTPHSCHYTTLWNVCANTGTEWSICHARFSHSQQLLKKFYAVILESFCSQIKRHFSGHTWKNTESPAAEKKQEKYYDKMPTQTINIETVTDGISQLVTNGWDTTLILVDHAIRISEACYPNIMLLQQFLHTIRYFSRKNSSPFFVFQQTWGTCALEAIIFLPIILLDLNRS